MPFGTRVIQACFSSVSNESNAHYTVYIPAGTYKITKTLRLFRVLGGLIVGQVCALHASAALSTLHHCHYALSSPWRVCKTHKIRDFLVLTMWTLL